ncbi:hypothetical protein [Streptomyces racemochromogenes]|uniref:hypothetical protein n=1 Tax=Streptomyces racemochromogenes TaxID=67353 RepID=UPI0031EB2A6E
MAITLYHFTKPEHWPAIDASGALEPRWGAAGRDVPKTIHLSDSPDRELLLWRFQTGYPICFQVQIPDVAAHVWHSWGKKYAPVNAHESLGIPVRRPDGMYLSRQNQGSGHWRVVERDIVRAEWVEIVDLEHDTVLWKA